MDKIKISQSENSKNGGVDHFVNLKRLKFHYVEWGSESSEPLLLLHGLRSSAETFDQLARSLCGKYRVIAIDQRGRGLTDWDPGRNYYPKEYVEDVVDFVKFLGLKKFHLLGHSMGGGNAILYAGSYPDTVASVVIEDSGPDASTSSEGAKRIREELKNTPIEFQSRLEARKFWRSIRPKSTEISIESRIENSMVVHDDGRVSWRHDQEGIAQSRLSTDLSRMPNLWPYVEAIRCPGLIIRGGNSDFLSRDVQTEMARRNPRLKIIEIENAGHYVHDDQPDRFISAVQNFLSDNPIVQRV